MDPRVTSTAVLQALDIHVIKHSNCRDASLLELHMIKHSNCGDASLLEIHGF